MIAVITTIAVVALGQLIARPSTQNDGWKPTLSDSNHQYVVRAQTESSIMSTESMVMPTASSSFTANDCVTNKLDHLRDELFSYKSFSTGWDGDESVPPDLEHIVAAASLIDVLPAGVPLPKPMLSSNGEIGLYWKDKRWLADAVIEDKNHFSLFIRSMGQGHKEVFIDSIVIGPNASNVIKSAFASV